MRPQKDYAIISIAMDKGGDNGDYIGKGIDKVEAPTGGLGRKLGLSPSDGESKEESDVRNAEQNPSIVPPSAKKAASSLPVKRTRNPTRHLHLADG